MVYRKLVPPQVLPCIRSFLVSFRITALNCQRSSCSRRTCIGCPYRLGLTKKVSSMISHQRIPIVITVINKKNGPVWPCCFHSNESALLYQTVVGSWRLCLPGPSQIPLPPIQDGGAYVARPHIFELRHHLYTWRWCRAAWRLPHVSRRTFTKAGSQEYGQKLRIRLPLSCRETPVLKRACAPARGVPLPSSPIRVFPMHPNPLPHL